MTHGGQLNISGLAQTDALTALRDNPNLRTEVSGMYRQNFVDTSGSSASRLRSSSRMSRLKYPLSVIRITPTRMNTWKVTDFPPDRTFTIEAKWREVA